MKYVHTNIVSQDWKKLADFYINVFECTPIQPERNISDNWLAKGTGVKNAALAGIHLLLSGYGKGGPTLEIFQYNKMIEKGHPVANRKGFGHIAFHVEDVKVILEKVNVFGGKPLGDLIREEFANIGLLTFVYIADPEGNIVEIQNWNYSKSSFKAPQANTNGYISS